jgi:hypothetical protein
MHVHMPAGIRERARPIIRDQTIGFIRPSCLSCRWAITSRRRRRHRRPCCRLLAGWRGSPGPRYRSFSPSRVPVSGPVVYSERRRGGRRGAAAPLLNLVNLFLPQMIRSQDWQESLRELPRSHSIVYRVTAQPYHKCPVPVG